MSFLAPWGLLLGLTAIPLVALYFLRIRRRQVRVPSLLLWHALKQSERLASPFERFKRNLLLFLQLLILLLITLALARPYLATEAAPYRSVVLVVDRSGSMGAADVAPSRFAEALSQARSIVSGLGPADEALLIGAGPTTEVLVPFTRSHGDIGLALDDLQVSEGQGSLREALQLALSLAKSRPDVEVVVLSDGSGEDLSTLTTGEVGVRFVRIGSRATNAGIIALDLRRSPVSELDLQLFATIQNYGRKEVQGSVEVYLDGELIGVRSERLPTDTPVSMVFEIAANKPGTLEVRLDAPGDLLAADDVAYAFVDKADSRRILLVGGDALTRRALSADPRLDLDGIAPEAVTRSLAASYDAVVFGGAVPDGMDGLSYLVLSPEHGGPVTFGPTVEVPEVLGWRRTHPTMRFVNWDGVRIARAVRVEDFGGLVSLVEGSEGPLVLGGERGGGRVLCLAFDVFHSDLPLRVAYPVLLLNAVSWLTEDTTGSVSSSLVQAGDIWVRRVSSPPLQTTASGPAGAVSVQQNDDMVRIAETDRVGIYRVRIDGVEQTFAANLLSQRESRIAPRSTLGLPAGASEVTAAEVAAGRREIWRPLLLLALGLLCLEWVLWNRRKSA